MSTEEAASKTTVISTNKENSIMSQWNTTTFRTRRPCRIRKRLAQRALYVGALCMCCTISWAMTIEGKVINRTTGEPTRGDEVILYRVDRSMHEEARARTNEHGDFRFDTRTGLRYLVAVRHQNVAYHTKTIGDGSRVEVNVYDAVAKIEQVREDSATLFFEVTPGTLKITEFFVLSNTSTPPRTLAGGSTFQFAVPGEATLDSVAVQPPETLPFETKSRPLRIPGQYWINSPIRPGVTKVRVKYSLPYSGTASFHPRVLRPVAAMALMIPESMRLSVDQPEMFTYTGKDVGLSVYMAKQMKPGRQPRLWVSSVGSLETTGTSAEDGTAASGLDASNADFLPGPSSNQGFLADTTRFVIVCFETPVLVIALVIVVAMLRERRQLSTQISQRRNGIESAGLGGSDRG